MLLRLSILLVSLVFACTAAPLAKAQDLVADCIAADTFRKTAEALSACTLALDTPNLERTTRAKLLTQQGKAFYRTLDFSSALTAFNAALALDPSLNIARIEKGWTLEVLGSYADATKVFVEAEKLDPKSAEVSYALGWMRWFVNGDNSVADLMEETLRKDPNYWHAHELLAIYYKEGKGDLETALKHYDIILNAPEEEVNKTEFSNGREFHTKDYYAQITLTKGDLLYDLGRYDEAEFIYKKLALKYPEEAMPLGELAGLYDRQRKFQLAFDTSLESLALDPHCLDCLIEKEKSAVSLHKNTEALEALNAIVNSKKPNSRGSWGEIYYFSGMALKALGQKDRARESFMNAFELSPFYRRAAIGQFIQLGYYSGQSNDPFSPRVETAFDACMADSKCLVAR